MVNYLADNEKGKQHTAPAFRNEAPGREALGIIGQSGNVHPSGLNSVVHARFHRAKKLRKKLFFLLLRLPERLNENNLRDAVDHLEALVDDPPAPEEPAAVVVDAGGERDGRLPVLQCDLHVPAGIEPDNPTELVEGFGDQLFYLVIVRERLAGKGRVEIDDDLGADDIDNRSFALFLELHGHTADGLLLELVLREGLHTLGVSLAERLVGRYGNAPFSAGFLADQFLVETEDDVLLADADRDRAVHGIGAVDAGLLCLVLTGGIENTVPDLAGIAQPDKISFVDCHDSPDYIKSSSRQIKGVATHARS